MDERKFTELVRDEVSSQYNKFYKDRGDEIGPEDVAIVWSVKVLGNNKAVAIVPADLELLYECTYNGTKKEMYTNTYGKIRNTLCKVL